MCRTVLVTSCKGGVGKSTVAANLSMALSSLGRRVILIDMDLGNRSLDLILGCEDSVVYDIADVCIGTSDFSQALISFDSPRNFLFCPAPFMYHGNITKENLKEALEQLRAQYSPDYIILDTSGGADISVELSASASDEAIIVSSRNPSSIRAAAKSGMLLESFGVELQRLIINGLELDTKKSDDRAGVLEIIDMTGVCLLGIIPKDSSIELLAEKGKLCGEGRATAACTAFLNTARRIDGEKVKLLSSVKGLSERQRRRILTGDLHKK